MYLKLHFPLKMQAATKEKTILSRLNIQFDLFEIHCWFIAPFFGLLDS